MNEPKPKKRQIKEKPKNTTKIENSIYGTNDTYRQHFMRLAENEEMAGNDFARDFNMEYIGNTLVSTFNKEHSFEIEDLVSKTQLNITDALADTLCKILPIVCSTSLYNGQFANSEHSILSILENYIDFLHVDRCGTNFSSLQLCYCLHIVNHITKAHAIMSSNENTETRDQGFTRTRSLILVPFRNSALRIVNMLELLIAPDNQAYKVGKNKFDKEFGATGTVGKNKPGDFRANFEGNCDDHFRIGICLGKNKLKLYVDYNSADILIASPLGLVTLIAEGRKGSFDFLSSVEILVVDQADVMYMQNWTHLVNVLKQTNMKVEELHGVDIMRIHEWQLNELNRHYRQLIVLSAQPFIELTAFFTTFSTNYAGSVAVRAPQRAGVVKDTATSVKHVFQRLKKTVLIESAENRFTFFTEQIFPELCRRSDEQIIIYISSYFDYTRVRNFCLREKTSFCFISEYSSVERVHKSRDMFFNQKVQLLVVTERFHFYHRYQLRGADSVVFYSLPTYPQFYTEFCGMIGTGGVGSVLCLFDHFDYMKVSAICGNDIADQLMDSMDSVFVMKSSP